jgi:hypothetical protein
LEMRKLLSTKSNLRFTKTILKLWTTFNMMIDMKIV